jgi:hypothetical protein
MQSFSDQEAYNRYLMISFCERDFVNTPSHSEKKNEIIELKKENSFRLKSG